jgi:hypothetical protein
VQLQGSADYFNGQMSATQLLGMSPAQQSKAAGQSTPPVTAAGGDRQQVPWSPDSPLFWVAVFGGLTVLGMAAADVKIRLFKRTAAAAVGTT